MINLELPYTYIKYTYINMNFKVKGGASVEQVIEDAEKLYKEYQDEKIDIRDDDRAKDALKRYAEKYHNFAYSYPIVFRYMIELNQYNSRALKSYLLYIQKHPWKNRNEFIESGADYHYALMRLAHPEKSIKYLKEQREEIRKSLHSDAMVLENEEQNRKKIAEEEEAELTKKLRESIKANLT